MRQIFKGLPRVTPTSIEDDLAAENAEKVHRFFYFKQRQFYVQIHVPRIRDLRGVS